MSYDVWLTVDTGGREPAVVADVGNYTSNVARMWREALGWPLGDFDGRNAGDSIGLLNDGVKRMVAEPDKYREMNPENGWGDYEGALDYLRGIAEACEQHPKAQIRISR